MSTDKRAADRLIGSDKVQGTAFYGANDEKIGSIARAMIDKACGKVTTPS